MSKQVDERVVSMQFDNRQFEKNVSTTMSTLEKLKQSLNFRGAEKGLEGINTAASKCNLAPLGNAVENVKVKFSAMEVVAITTLTNITNSAVNAGKRLVSSLSVDQVTAGWNKYEQKTASVQTIMNATGKSIDEVNQYLNKLMWFSDETSYGFTDMTAALGQMTASGGDIDKLIPLITGVANATAYAGKGAAEFTRAMYNLNQSYTKGYLDYMDWKSLDLAGVSSKQLKETLIETGEALGKIKKGEVTLENFATTLKDKWADTDVMEKAFGKFGEFSDAVHQMVQSGEVDTASEAIEKLSDKYDELGVKAFKSAQEAKSFSEAIDATKDAVSSGWMNTFEIIFGDYEKAKKIWTGLANVLWDVFASGAERRNTMLADVFDSNWDKLTKKINDAGISTEEFEESIRNSSVAQKELTKKNKKLDDLVEEYGSLGAVFQAGALSADVLKDAIAGVTEEAEKLDLSIDRLLKRGTTGDDVKKAQKALKQLGYELGKFGDNADGIDGIFGTVTEAAVRAFQEEHGLKIDGIVGPETIKALEETAAALNETSEETKNLKEELNDLIENVDELGGRQKLIDTFAKLWEKITKVWGAAGEVWNKVFEKFPKADELIMRVIDSFAKFVDGLEDSEAKIQSITTTIEGFLRVIELCAIFSGGVFGLLIKIFKTVADELDVDFWNITETIAEMIIAFRNWLIKNNIIYESLKKLGNIIISFVKGTIGAIKDLYNGFVKLESVQMILDTISKAFEAFKTAFGPWLSKLGELIGKFFSWLTSGSLSFAKLEAVCKLYFSKITKHFEDLEGVIEPLKEALGDLGGAFVDYISKFEPIGKIIEWFKNAKKAFDDWRNGVAGSEDLPKRIAESIVNGLVIAVQVVGSVLSTLWNKVTSYLTGDGGEKVADGIISGFVNGIWDGLRLVGNVMLELGKAILEKVMDFLGIHSPSRVFVTIGLMCIAGLVLGLRQGSVAMGTSIGDIFSGIIESVKNSGLLETLEKYFGGILDFFGNISFADIFTLGGIGLLVFTVKKLSDALDIIAGGFKSVNKLIGNAAGVLDALKDGIGRIGKAVANNINAMAFKNLATAIAILVGSVVALVLVPEDRLWPAVGAVVALTAALGIMFIAIDKFTGKNPLANPGKLIDFAKIMSGLMTMAMAMLTFSLVAKIIGGMKPEEFNQAMSGMVLMTAMMVGLIAATKLMARTAKGNPVDDIQKIGKMLKGIATAMIIMAIAARLMGGMDADAFQQAVSGLILLTAIMVGLIAATKLIAKTDKGNTAYAVYKVGTMLMGIATAMVIMAIAAKMIGSMETDDFNQAVSGLMLLTGLIVGLIAATKLIARSSKSGGVSSEIFKIGTMLLAIAGAMLVMVIAAKMIASIDDSDILKAGVGLVVLAGLMVGLMAATKLVAQMSPGVVDKDLFKIGTMLLAVAGAMLLLTFAAKVIASMSWSELGKAAVGLVVVGLIITGLIWATNLATDKDIMKAGVTLTLVAAAIVILSAAVLILGLLDLASLAKGVAAVAVLGVIMAGLMAASHFAKDCHKNIMMIAIAMGVMAIAVAALSFIPVEDLKNAVVAVELLMLTFGVVVMMSNAAKASMGTLIVLTGIIVLLGGVIFLLSQYADTKKCLEAAFALSTIMLALAGVLWIISGVSATATSALPAALALLALCFPLLGVALILNTMSDTKNALDNALALILLMGAMTLLLIPLTDIGASGMTGAPYLGVLALTVLCIPLVGLVHILKQMDGIQNAEANTMLLITLASVLTGLCVILTGVGAFAPAALAGIGILTLLMLAIGVMIGVIGGLGLTDYLPTIGDNIGKFMTNARPFIDGANDIKASTMQNIKMLVEAIGMLTSAGILDGITSWLSGESAVERFGKEIASLGSYLKEFSDNVTGMDSIAATTAATVAMSLASMASVLPDDISLDGFGEELVSFGSNLKAFSDNVIGIDSTAVTAAAAAAKSLAEMANVVPNEGGVASWFAGENSLAAFGPQIASFGSNLKQFATNVAGVNVETITAAAEAGKALVDMANTVPNEGGMASWFAGENSLAAFSSNLGTLGSNMALFVSNLGTFGTDQVTMVSSAAEALKTLAEATNTIPNEGGMVSWFAGENSLSAFSNNLPTLGSNMASFVSNLGTFSEDQVTTVGCVASAIKELATATNTIPNEGGMASWFAGENSLASLSGNLPGLGTNMASFVTNLGSFTEAQVATVRSAVSAINAFALLSDSDLGSAKKHIEGFGGKLAGFGEDLAEFCSKLGAESGVDTAVSNMKKLVGAAKEITDGSVTAVKDLGKALKDFAKDGVDGFVSAFTSSEAKTDVKEAAAKLAEKVIDGFESKEDSIGDALKTLSKSGAEAIKTGEVERKFKSAGKFVVDGFKNGITDNTFKAEAAAKAMAEASLAAAKAALAQNSPSKEFIKVGKGVGEGFAVGIQENTGMALSSTGVMANGVMKEAKTIFAKVSDALVNGIDADPVIRPVLDLSGVRADASTIAGLFDMNPSVGVMANVGAISRGMARGQNGTTIDDAISEIKGVKDAITQQKSGDTYSIGNISYDDGTEVSNAIKTLVKAARVERRR